MDGEEKACFYYQTLLPAKAKPYLSPSPLWQKLQTLLYVYQDCGIRKWQDHDLFWVSPAGLYPLFLFLHPDLDLEEFVGLNSPQAV